jgi:hypothetical protein
VRLAPEALEEYPSLYAWDRATKQISLASVRNDETSPPKGTNRRLHALDQRVDPQSLRLGGSLRGFYLRDERAIGPDCSDYFTEAGTGQLYRRINPAAPQSAFTTAAKAKRNAAKIESDDLAGGPVEDKGFISLQRAIGLAVDGDHIYWVDPRLGTIGRADLNGDNKDLAFIEPGTTKCEVKGEPRAFEDVEAIPLRRRLTQSTSTGPLEYEIR